MQGYTIIAVLLWFVIVTASQKTTTANLVETYSRTRPLSVLLATVPHVGHVTPILALGEELVGRGHNVTLISDHTDYVQREIVKRNITLWSIEGSSDHEMLNRRMDKGEAKQLILQTIKLSIDFHTRLIKTIDNPTLKEYDVIIGDAVYFTSLMCISQRWNITAIYMSFSILSAFDFHAWPFPAFMSGYSDNLFFLQRLVSTLQTNTLFFVIKAAIHVNSMFSDSICKRANISPSEVVYFAHYHPVIIVTSFGFEFPHATLPLTHYVGPLISPSQPQLPQDMTEVLESRDPRTVVYVSMGSAATLSSVQAEMIINGATQANLSVLWSLRKRNQHILQHMTYDPDKVLISEWVPQATVLKHPSIHSAILHGGLGGVQEALSCGVPVIVTPFFYDQIDNAVRVQHYHYGEMIYLHELTTSLVTQKLKLIESDLYQKSLEKIQKLYKKDGGASRAADLVEFYSDVGYEHLIPSFAKYNWSWIEFYNVDVYAVLLLAVLLPSYILYRVIRRFCSSIVSTSKKKVD